MRNFLLPLLPLLALSSSLFGAELLPAFRPNDVIVFQGDSITDGGRARVGNDHNHTMGQGYAYLVTARISAMLPERNLTFWNRGNSGEKVSDLAGRWQQDTIALKPTLLSILVGINDCGGHTPMDAFEKTYDKLLADTLAALPSVRIVLCTPFTLPVGNHKDDYATWSADVKQRGLIVEKLAAKYHLPVVKLQPILEAACQKVPANYWLWDGIHPDYCGHYLLAQEWLRVVNSFYGKAPGR